MIVLFSIKMTVNLLSPHPEYVVIFIALCMYIKLNGINGREKQGQEEDAVLGDVVWVSFLRGRGRATDWASCNNPGERDRDSEVTMAAVGWGGVVGP